MAKTLALCGKSLNSFQTEVVINQKCYPFWTFPVENNLIPNGVVVVEYTIPLTQKELK